MMVSVILPLHPSSTDRGIPTDIEPVDVEQALARFLNKFPETLNSTQQGTTMTEQDLLTLLLNLGVRDDDQA